MKTSGMREILMQMDIFQSKSFKRISKQRVFEGSYGCVYLADHERGSFAIKRYKTTVGVPGINNLRELDVIARCQHPFVVRFVGIVVGDPFDKPSHNKKSNVVFDEVSIVMERAEMGLDALEVPMSNATLIAFETSLAVRHLHRLGIIHRDIKRDNILLHRGDQCSVRLIDFGMAEYHSTTTAPEMRVCIMEMRPPEVHLNDQYDFAIDVWAMGCLLFEITTGERFVRSNARQSKKVLGDLLRRFTRDEIATQKPSLLEFVEEDGVSLTEVVKDPQLADLLVGMLHLDARKRLTMEEVVDHPWFSELRVLVKDVPQEEDISVRLTPPATKTDIDDFARRVYDGRLHSLSAWYTHHILFHFISLAYRLESKVDDLVFVLYLCVKILNLDPPDWKAFIEDLGKAVDLGRCCVDESRLLEFEIDVVKRLNGRLYQHTIIDVATRQGGYVGGEVAQKVLDQIFSSSSTIETSTLSQHL